MRPPEIVLRGLSRQFQAEDDAFSVLRGIDLTVRPGEFVAITGRSGSGKSTLLHILGCLDGGYDGSCRIDGIEIKDCDDRTLAQLRRRTFGYVFQHFGLIQVLTCAENVRLPAFYDGASRGRQAAVTDEFLARFGLRHRAERFPVTLSGGEQQRAAIARALVNAASVIIADEPTGALDRTNADAVMSMLDALHREGRTIVLVTHDSEIAEKAGRIVSLADGLVVDERSHRKQGIVEPSHSAAPDWPPSPGDASLWMRLREASRTALRTLNRRWLQSALTILGIAIGSASVVAFGTIGDGARRQIIEQIEALGSDLVTISRGPPGVRGGERLVTSLIADDILAISGLPGVIAQAPEIDGVVVAKHNDRDFMVTLTGTNEDFPRVRDWPIERGNFFGTEDLRRYAQVAVLGVAATENLFGVGVSPVGRQILINGNPFLVVGVLERKGVTTGPGHDRDNQVWVPHTTASARVFARRYIERIVVKIERGTDPYDLASDIKDRMLARHKREDFSVNALAEVIRAATRAQRTLDYFLATIAVIAVLASGVGVMNIMLASVNERVGEIGIRMAIGATRQDILMQFLGEATVLCLAGGIAGVLLGVIAVEMTAAFSGIPAKITFLTMLSAVGSAISVGLVFGTAPALRAAAIEPVEAFRRAA